MHACTFKVVEHLQRLAHKKIMKHFLNVTPLPKIDVYNIQYNTIFITHSRKLHSQ